jgi:cyclic pyranopterin phosphate synthase
MRSPPDEQSDEARRAVTIAAMAVLDTRGRPLTSLRESVTDRCNLRCEYCMPERDYLRGG